MSADRGGTNELKTAALDLLGCAAWGLGCGVVWQVIIAVGMPRGSIGEGAWAAFFAASMTAAIAAGRWAPRIAGSWRLLSIGVVAGLATVGLVQLEDTRALSAEFIGIFTVIFAPLCALRLVLDLFARRRAPLTRRLAALIAAPFSVILLLFALRTAQGRSFSITGHDRVVFGSLAALGLAIVPPRRFEAPAAD